MTPPLFYRKVIRLRTAEPSSRQTIGKPRQIPSQQSLENQKQVVLIINGSAEMAGAITRELLYSLPDASIMYSPTLDLASWILKSRTINLIISSEILPDGGPQKIQSILQNQANPPDLLIVGRSVGRSITHLSNAGYHLIKRRNLSRSTSERVFTPRDLHAPRPTLPNIKSQVSTLGADLRNDLNNPLQEIVTMAFVARQSDNQRELSDNALEAIERAARQLAGTVEGIEERIRAVVGE